IQSQHGPEAPFGLVLVSPGRGSGGGADAVLCQAPVGVGMDSGSPDGVASARLSPRAWHPSRTRSGGRGANRFFGLRSARTAFTDEAVPSRIHFSRSVSTLG